MLYSKIEGQGRPLLILHGFLGMSDNWKSLSVQFAAAGFQVHTPDLRNHGRSFHSDDFTYKAMVEDILAYCNFHNLETIDLIGHSMGGKIAMFLAVNFPEKVDKLIIADIAPKYYSPHHQDIFDALNAVDFNLYKTRATVEEVLSKYIPDFNTRQFLMKSLYWETPEKLAFRFNLKVFNTTIDSIGESLGTGMIFSKPVLFLRGEKSKYILDSDFSQIAHHFPQSKVVTIKKAGHWLHADNPQDFLQASLHFLQ